MALHPKAITFLSIVLGLAVVAVLAFLFRGWFVEEWHLWQLQSESEEVRKDAATALVALGSTKAVPALFEAWERDIRTKEQSGKPYRIGLPTTEVVKSWGKELMGFWRLASGFHNDGNAFYIHHESFDFHYCMKALSTIVQGSVDEALPFVIDKTEPGNPYSQWLAIILLVEFASDRESTATAGTGGRRCRGVDHSSFRGDLLVMNNVDRRLLTMVLSLLAIVCATIVSYYFWVVR